MDITGIHHLGLAVCNLKATSEFFVNCLGWKITREILDYPATFVSNGNILITLWQTKEGANDFDRKINVGLHHLALLVASEEELSALYKKVSRYPNIKVEFEPELLRGGSAKHCMFYDPSGIRIEFIWTPQ